MLRHLSGIDSGFAKLGADAARPERADWTIDQGWDTYTPQDHAVWKTLFERQLGLLDGPRLRRVRPRHALVADWRGADSGFPSPVDALMKRTGWQVVAVPGLVPDEVFFEHLANRRFPAGNFIRRPTNWTTSKSPTSSMMCSATCPCSCTR